MKQVLLLLFQGTSSILGFVILLCIGGSFLESFERKGLGSGFALPFIAATLVTFLPIISAIIGYQSLQKHMPHLFKGENRFQNWQYALICGWWNIGLIAFVLLGIKSPLSN